MKIIGVIPARYKSSRFPGKPLADICGKPMIWWVYQQVLKSEVLDEIYVATEDERIKAVCEKENINVVMTSDRHPTGTDRAAEVAEKTNGDIYVVVMGDEPLISPENVKTVVDIIKTSVCDAGMLCTKFKNGVDLINNSTIKLAINSRNELIYMSRLPIPYPKSNLNYNHYKNVGVYAFTRESLELFNKTPRGYLENIEDIEMFRMLENHKVVKVKEVEKQSISVDTYKDLERIRGIIAENYPDLINVSRERERERR